MGNSLRLIREKHHLTQKECAAFLGVPLRTYQNYENDPSKVGNLKYNQMLYLLNERFKIDETHGILNIDDIKEQIGPVLEAYGVSYAYIFGSYAKAYQTEKSDVDLFIHPAPEGFEFFGLVGELKEVLHKEVDVVYAHKDFSNRDFIFDEIMKSGFKIYG